MDDSERSYGYSDDIYHGKRGAGGHYDRTNEDAGHSPDPERSYEYGPEASESVEPEAMSPEEAAIHLDDEGLRRSTVGTEREGGYDYDRTGTSAEVDSFTWDAEPQEEGRVPAVPPVPETAGKR
jgi:hypothetical protein